MLYIYHFLIGQCWNFPLHNLHPLKEDMEDMEKEEFQENLM